MTDLFFKGGPLFMFILSFVFLLLIGVGIYMLLSIMTGKINNPEEINKRLFLLKEIGLFALIIGLIAQLISLFSAFRALQLRAVESTVKVVSDGFLISTITPLFGLSIFIISQLLVLGLKRIFAAKHSNL